jgi:rod shape-determining protein MreC
MINKNSKIFFFLFLVFVLFFFNFPKTQPILKNFFFHILERPSKFFWQTGNQISKFFSNFKSIEDLNKQNENLKKEVENLSSKVVEVEILQKENKSLRELLSLGLKKEFEIEMAKVFGKDFLSDKVFIDKGEKDGIKENQVVFFGQKILVGKVEKVYPNYSTIKLITAKKISIPSKIVNKEIFGFAEGEGNFKIFLKKVPKEAQVEKEDFLYTILSENFPEGFLVGKVKEIKKKDVDPFQEIEIEPFFSIKDLDIVFVIKNYRK